MVNGKMQALIKENYYCLQPIVAVWKQGLVLLDLPDIH